MDPLVAQLQKLKEEVVGISKDIKELNKEKRKAKEEAEKAELQGEIGKLQAEKKEKDSVTHGLISGDIALRTSAD